MNRKKLRLKPAGAIILVLTALVLLLGIQNVVLVNRNNTLKTEVVTYQTQPTVVPENNDEQIQSLNDQITKLSSENQTLMQSNIELQNQLNALATSTTQNQPAQITTDDATPTPDTTETVQPDAQDASGSPSNN